MRPVIGITADADDRHFKINRHYADYAVKAGALPLILAPSGDIRDAALKIDGLLVPGGDDIHPSYYTEGVEFEIKIVDRERSDFEIALVREIIGLGKPVMGICYGMQLINVALGGSLYQDIKSRMPFAVEHKKDYHIIRVMENKIIAAGEYNVNTSHHQAIKVLGKGLEAVARSSDGIIEAFCMPGHPFLLGVQWHPERMNDELSARIFRSFVEASSGK